MNNVLIYLSIGCVLGILDFIFSEELVTLGDLIFIVVCWMILWPLYSIFSVAELIEKYFFKIWNFKLKK